MKFNITIVYTIISTTYDITIVPGYVFRHDTQQPQQPSFVCDRASVVVVVGLGRGAYWHYKMELNFYNIQTPF